MISDRGCWDLGDGLEIFLLEGSPYNYSGLSQWFLPMHDTEYLYIKFHVFNHQFIHQFIHQPVHLLVPASLHGQFFFFCGLEFAF